MVFQDGGAYVGEKGQFRVPIVFDNLIHQKKIPVMIGIFPDNGRLSPGLSGETVVYHSKGFDRIRAGKVKEQEPVPISDYRQYALAPFPTLSQYFADPDKGTIEIHPTASVGRGVESIKVDGLKRPSGIAHSPDGWTMYVGDADSKYIWAFRIEESRKLTAGQPYGLLRTKPKQQSGVTSLETDSAGRIYATTSLGVQILDPTGRLCGVLTKPTNEPLVGIAFGGPDGHSLYLASKTAVSVRKVKSQGLGFAKAK